MTDWTSAQTARRKVSMFKFNFSDDGETTEGLDDTLESKTEKELDDYRELNMQGLVRNF